MLVHMFQRYHGNLAQSRMTSPELNAVLFDGMRQVQGSFLFMMMAFTIKQSVRCFILIPQKVAPPPKKKNIQPSATSLDKSNLTLSMICVPASHE